MNLLLLLLLVFPFACLAVLSLVALLGVVAIGGALGVIGVVSSALGIARRKDDDALRGAVSDAHPLEYVERDCAMVVFIAPNPLPPHASPQAPPDS